MDLLNTWIEALESDRYEQGKGELCRKLGDGKRAHCCLGVLCDLVDPNGWIDDGFSGFGFKYGEQSRPYSDLPSHEVLTLVGLTNDDAANLAYLNDDLGFTFKQIAERLKAKDFSTGLCP